MADDPRFEQAEQAYRDGDWRAAAQGYLAVAQEGGDGAARAFCKAGNALTKLHRWADAAAVYRHALADPEYATRGAVWANLGAALLETGEYDESLAAYDRALGDPAYTTRWRALQGRAGALAAEGRNAEAAASYREAALEPDNPDPGRALNNLGLQFMALDRPEDATEAYRAALDLPEYQGKGRVNANLGLAYQRLGLSDRAGEAFAAARALGFGTDALETAEQAQPAATTTAPEAATDAPIEGESAATAEDPALAPGSGASEADSAEAGASADEAPETASAPPGASEPAAVPGTGQGMDTDFFDLTDEDMRRIDRERRDEERAQPKSRRGLWSAIAATVLVLALLAGLVAAALLTGFGWPSQQGVTKDMLEAWRAGKDVDQYWVAVPAADIDKEMARIPPTFKSMSVGAAKNTSLSTARVSVSVTIENGSPLDYVVALEREGVGWRVAGIDNDFRSTTGTP